VLRAVLDANVYISAAIRPEGPPGQIIESFLQDSAFELIVSLPSSMRCSGDFTTRR
jgi:predicted nucleic acid-binding protein